MAPPKGKTNNPKGKPKGVKHKKTREQEEAVLSAIEFIHQLNPEFQKAVRKEALNDYKSFIKTYTALMEFVYPKKARVEHSGDLQTVINLIMEPIPEKGE